MHAALIFTLVSFVSSQSFNPALGTGKTPSEDEASEKSEELHMVEAVDLRSVLAALGLLSGTFLAVLLGLRFYLHCLRRRPHRESRRKKMTEEEINQRFPVTRQEGEPTCVVCLATIEADDKCRVTQCGHSFHADCLVAWWLHKPKRILRCPICRTRQRFHDKKKSKVRHSEGQALPDSEEGPSQEEQLHAEAVDVVAGQELEESSHAEDEASPAMTGVAESPAIGIVVADSPHDRDDSDDTLTAGVPLPDSEKPQAPTLRRVSM